MASIRTASATPRTMKERITFQREQARKFHQAGSLSTIGLRMKTAAPAWAIPVRWSGGITRMSEPQETNLGLLGPIIITRRGMARPDGSPRDVDREFVMAFFIFNELNGEEPGLMHGINGYIFGNLRGLEMTTGERV